MQRFGPVTGREAIRSRQILISAGNRTERTVNGIQVAASDNGVGCVRLDGIIPAANDGRIDWEKFRTDDPVEATAANDRVVGVLLNHIEVAYADHIAKTIGLNEIADAAAVPR